ncbi:MAG: DUF2065 domain-containing protein [Gammaproteobacteria bacterium]|nr:DUF2065 domain-containing protein [Gammaproteobacteria bacterium]
MTQLFVMALGLVFIFEGFLPFLGPRIWRRLMQQMIIKNDRSLQLFGLISMLVGLSVLYLTR